MTLRVSRRWAAAEQLERAIECLFSGELASAISLSGAAEDSLPSPNDQSRDLFNLLKNGAKERGLEERAFVSDHANKIRNWLKHHADKNGKPKPDEIDIEQFHAVIHVIRAYTRFTSIFGDDQATPTMLRFEAWFREAYGDLLTSGNAARPRSETGSPTSRACKAAERDVDDL